LASWSWSFCAPSSLFSLWVPSKKYYQSNFEFSVSGFEIGNHSTVWEVYLSWF
jgi:hypothetical protein